MATLAETEGCPHNDTDTSQFLLLPAEIIEHILKCATILHSDVARFTQVCRTFRDTGDSKEIWKCKMRQRWKQMLDRYERGQVYDWKEEYKNRHIFVKKVITLVRCLSPKFYCWEEVSKEGFVDFSKLLSDHQHAGEFMVDELAEIVHDGDKNKNLTDRYYAEKVLRFLQQKQLSHKITEFLQQPSQQQSLETGAILIAQWCQPTEGITANSILDQLDRIAADVRTLVEQTCPSHPLLATEAPFRHLNENKWSCDHCRILLSSLNSVFFNTYKFCGNKKDYYNQTNSYIDQVLQKQTGIPISLCVVYSCIACRLGVFCEPVNFPSHFLLRWKEHPLQSPDKMYTYIDVFNGGKFIEAGNLSRQTNVPESLINMDSIKINNPSQVFERMARNLVSMGRQQGRMGDSLLSLRNALELFLLISPDDLDTRLLQVRVNLHLNINLPDVIDSLQTIADYDQNRMGLVAYLMNAAHTQMQENEESEQPKPITVKSRVGKKKVKWPVGLVMKHKRYNYMCVIYGWDATCQASQEWIIQMGVNNLPQKEKQPFYNVLVDDGTSRYAAEENLMFPDSAGAIPHPEIGRYFEQYCGQYYVPNQEKQTEYPGDTDLVDRLTLLTD